MSSRAIGSTASAAGTRTPFVIEGFDSVGFAVGNAFQSAHFLVTAFGMTPVAYRGPETGSRDECSYVLRAGATRFVVTGPTRSRTALGEHVAEHGDSVFDVGIRVSNVEAAFRHAVAAGASGLDEPHELRDADGAVRLASFAAYGPVRHTFVDRSAYRAAYLPGYQPCPHTFPQPPPVPYFTAIDHCVAAVEAGRMDEWVDFYQRVLGGELLAEFIDGEISTRYSALRSKVVADRSRRVRFPVVEPAPSERASQVEEFLRFHGGPGVQHVALATGDILRAVDGMRAAGVQFLPAPAAYYEDPGLLARMGPISSPISELRDRGVLVDQDENGHLLQILTKPVQDRPTGFFELIERHGSEGFGVGNFAALFHAIEREQDRRGNL
ncbi:4-hydroxyphenylpyruvate dioxygenase [Streptomyces sp. NRRL S-920]|uniref:4-hydroxyphenylpyruvate dioxygenase n=1 Tax=Streptomyces sp. NRRL S-920 TaxID=1463921 RepID=UPI000997525A|nr:4-hydroxyphenylpyruvate dioxygenase [Streptomyces sp. NRRL S-920]